MDTLKLNKACITKIKLIQKKELLDDSSMEKMLNVLLFDVLLQWLDDIMNGYVQGDFL